MCNVHYIITQPSFQSCALENLLNKSRKLSTQSLKLTLSSGLGVSGSQDQTNLQISSREGNRKNCSERSVCAALGHCRQNVLVRAK